MTDPPADARSFTAEIVAVQPVGEDAVRLRLRPEIALDPVRASRFFMLRREDALSPLLPRPFSVYRQDSAELEFLIKVVGRGTRALAGGRLGERLRVVGPLGNGWPPLDGAGDPWVLLAGGIGCVPFWLAIEQALDGLGGAEPLHPSRVTMLFGAARAGLLYDLAGFRTLGVKVETATDDGSEGFHGTVLDLLASLVAEGSLPPRARLLACGPEPMLAAVLALARERDLDCWLSLEGLMGCGVGICNGCPVPTRPEGALGHWPNAKCCTEGPVFSARDIAGLA